MANKTNYNFSPIVGTVEGSYKGRPLIGPDMDIRGGVFYVGLGDAIVVDPERYPEEYRRVFRQALRRSAKGGKVDSQKVPRAVYDTTMMVMPNSRKNSKYVDEEVAAIGDGSLVELSAFIHAGAGACRHKAALVAATLEEFKDRGHIDGDISFEMSARRHVTNKKDTSGHAWVRYTHENPDGDEEILIIDPTHGVFDTLDGTVRDGSLGWSYLRPEEEAQDYYADLATQTVSVNALTRVMNDYRELAQGTKRGLQLTGALAMTALGMSTIGPRKPKE